MQPSRDRDCLNAAHDLLVATDEFDLVPLDTPIADLRATSDSRAVALLECGDQADESRTGSPVTLMHTRQFTVTLALRVEEDVVRSEALERLANVACNAINGQSLAGQTFFDQTWLKTGKTDKSRHPE